MKFVPTIESIQFPSNKNLLRSRLEGGTFNTPIGGDPSQLEGGSRVIATSEGVGVINEDNKGPLQDTRSLQQGLEYKQKVYGDGNTFNKDNYDRTYRLMGNIPAPGVAAPKRDSADE